MRYPAYSHGSTNQATGLTWRKLPEPNETEFWSNFPRNSPNRARKLQRIFRQDRHKLEGDARRRAPGTQTADPWSHRPPHSRERETIACAMPQYDYAPVAAQHHRAEAPSIAELVRGRPYDPQSCTGNLSSPYVGSPPTIMPFKCSMDVQAELIDRSGRHGGQHDPQLTVAGPLTFCLTCAPY